MNLAKIIAELKAERDRVEAAILALERLSLANAKRRVKAGMRVDGVAGSSPDSPADHNGHS